MLINYNSLNNSDSFSSFPNSSLSAIAGVQNDHQFGGSANNQNNSLDQSSNNFAVPQQTAAMSEVRLNKTRSISIDHSKYFPINLGR